MPAGLPARGEGGNRGRNFRNAGVAMTWIHWALRANLPTPEKLVLVYLCLATSESGVGEWNREALASTLGYKRRSVQRLLKSLRGSGHLADLGTCWYVVNPPADLAGLVTKIDDLPPPALGVHRGPMTLGEIAAAEGPLLSPAELERAGEAISRHVVDAADYFVDQLNAFEARLAQQLVQGLRALQGKVDQLEASAPKLVHVEPPPDPVRTDPLFATLIGAGTADAEAYLVVAALQKRRAEQPRETAPPAAPARAASATATEPRRYSDDVEGRCNRVLDALDADPDHHHVATGEQLRRWLEIEALESKHTVDGETDAFLLLYPAIVDAAKRNAGRLPFEAFVDLRAIADGRAPWDLDPAPAPSEDASLAAEIGVMLRDLEAANDPRCSVQPRTTEKGDDGVTRVEPVLAYYRRVRAKHSEMLRLRQMGVI